MAVGVRAATRRDAGWRESAHDHGRCSASATTRACCALHRRPVSERPPHLYVP